MVTMISRRTLEPGDFDAWKTRFEQGAAERRAAGCRGVRRFRNLHAPNELIVIFDWDTEANARAYVAQKLAGHPGAAIESVFVDEMPALPS